MAQHSDNKPSSCFSGIRAFIENQIPADDYWPLVMLIQMLKDAPHICLQHPQEIARALVTHEQQMIDSLLPMIRPRAGALLYKAGIVDHGPRGTDLYLLNNGSDLSSEERDQLVTMCESHILSIKQHTRNTTSKTGCLFCELPDSVHILDENSLCLVIADHYPVTEGHCLIIPKRHVETWFDMKPGEVLAANQLLQTQRARLMKQDKLITGFNIGMNAGDSAGQTIFHAHMHLIPRRDGDQDNPRGGIRKIFPDKADYSHDR